MAPQPPLALDIDGTLTRRGGGIEPAVFDVLADWSAPIVLATGKAFPYPVALCHYATIPERCVAENGGVVAVDDAVEVLADTAWIPDARTALARAGIDLGWGEGDLVNRWRETELAVARDASRRAIESALAELPVEVIDSGYAYHVKSPAVSKGDGLRVAADRLGIDPGDLVAVGDSENDVPMFEAAGHAIALDNADDAARGAADEVVAGGFAAGTLQVLARWRPA